MFNNKLIVHVESGLAFLQFYRILISGVETVYLCK